MFWRKKTQEIEDPITTELKRKGAIVLLDGNWGVGKTYRFQKEIQPQLKKSGYNVQYISLFGVKDTEEIRKTIYKYYIEQKHGYLIGCISAIIIAVLFVWGSIYICDNLLKEYFSDFIKGILLILFNSIFVPFISSKVYIITRHLLDKYLGINHNTVSVTELFNSKKTVFCFDDIERISEKASIDEFLGFINTLAKTDGFSVLVISCYTKCFEPGDRKNLTTLYKEKVFDYQINDEISDIKIKDVFNEYASISSNAGLLEYIQNMYRQLQEQEIAVGTNLRTLQKLCRNLVTINDAIGGFEKLEKNYTDSGGVWAYITYLTLAKDRNENVSYKYDLSKNLLNDKKTEKEKIEDILLENAKNSSFSVKYKSIYDSLIYGRTNQEKLKKELLPFEYGDYTEFEQRYLPLQKKGPFCLEYEERERIKQQIENDFTIEKPLFSSVNNMQSLLFFYLEIYQCTETCLEKEILSKVQNIIKTNTKVCPAEELQDVISNNRYEISTANTSCVRQKKEIMDFIIECSILALAEKYKDSWKNELRSDNSLHRAIAILSISFFPEVLFEICQTDFQRFKNIVHQIWAGYLSMLSFLKHYNIMAWIEKYKKLLNDIKQKFEERLVQLHEEDINERRETEKYIREIEALINKL